MTSDQQLAALLWKNGLMKIRSVYSILAEIVFPAVLCVAMFANHIGEDSSFEKMNAGRHSLLDVVDLDNVTVLFYSPASQAVSTLIDSDNNERFDRILPFASPQLAHAYQEQTISSTKEYLEKGSMAIPVVSFELGDTVGRQLRFRVVVGFNYHPNHLNGRSQPNEFFNVMELQYQLTRIFINYWRKQQQHEPYKLPEVHVQRMPSELDHLLVRDLFLDYTLIYPMMFIGIFSFTASAIVEERETKTKEFMKLMGLRESFYWISWFISTFFSGLIVSISATAVMLYRYPLGPILSSPASIAMTMNVIYVINTISAAFVLSCLINKGRNAAIIAIILYLILQNSCVPILINLRWKAVVYLIGTLFYAFGFFVCSNVMYEKELIGHTLDWDNINVNQKLPSQTFLDGLVLMLINTLFNIFLCWYVNTIYPGEYGIAEPWYFLFSSSYWLPGRKTDIALPKIELKDPEFFEAPPADLTPGIQVRNLVKVFGKHVAVAGTNIDLYEGQITALLGHNGAGKTTTINVITGFLPATSGTVTVHGFDLMKNTKAARNFIGLCPQYDVLFSNLSCRENLMFVLKIKNQYSSEKLPEIDNLLDMIGLRDKKKFYPTQISGGQRRKLSLGSAFIGGTKVVFLDEPSTGLDPAARQEMWAFLKTMREGRTILLTTHYMDEADVLGDRIAIMAEGRVKCCGTPMFLKRVYGTGYKLKIFKNPDCEPAVVHSEIIKNFPEAVFGAETDTEIEYELPDKLEEKYPGLLKVLEDDAQQLHISGYALVATTLEDVFIKSGEEPAVSEVDPSPNPSTTVVHNVKKEPESNDVFRMFQKCRIDSQMVITCQQLKAIFVKKWLLFQRNMFLTLSQSLLPSLLIIIGLLGDFSRDDYDPDQLQSMTISPKRYSDLIIPIRFDAQLTTGLIDAFKAQSPSSDFHIVTGRMIEEYCQDWARRHTKEEYDNKMVFGMDFNENTLFYQINSLHSTLTGMQMLMNAHIKNALGQDFSMEAGLQYESNKILNRRRVFEFLTLMSISLAMALIPVGFIYVLLSERACGAKHLQALSGVHPFAYWFATFVFDYIFYLLQSGAMLGVLTIMSVNFIQGDRWMVTFTMFVVFGLATIPYLYALQNFFHSPVAGITVLLIMNIIIGMVLGSINADNKLEGEKMTGFWDVVDKACSFLSPNYVLAGAMVIMLKETHFDEKLGVSVKDTPEERNKFDYLFKRDDSYMADSAYKLLFLAVASWFLVLFMDYKMYRVIGYKTKCLNVKEGLDEVKTKEDDDVIEERQRILQTDKESLFDTDAMLLVNVSKKYFSRPEVAVYKTCLGVKEKECLGLLGQNGAGKTTTFKMLTGDIAMSNGDAYFKGKNIKTHLRKVQSTMSYVPQFDALHDELTGRETLYLYGRLRGVRENCLSDLTEFLIDFVALRPHEDKCTFTYSGGNKRKLSVGISIIGDPQFIMLDEPTAGVDPVCRRILWNCLQVIRSLAKTLVLTSHSMEECEALCTRLAIFKKGKMLCLGSPQHLKTKFGKGFSVLLQASEKPDGTLHPLQPAVEFITEKIPGVNVFDNTPYYCHMQVSEVTPLSEIFEVLVEAKTTFFLRHFLVQQKSLEQVFLLLMHQD